MFTQRDVGATAKRSKQRHRRRLSGPSARAALLLTGLLAACVCAAYLIKQLSGPAALERLPAIAPLPERAEDLGSSHTDTPVSRPARRQVDWRLQRRRERGREAKGDSPPRARSSLAAPPPVPAPPPLAPPASTPPVAPGPVAPPSPPVPVRPPRRSPLPVKPGAPPEFM
jgi:hypothetical protein